MVNLFEFAFGLNPRIGADGQWLPFLAVIELIERRYVLRCSQPLGATGITYGAQYSTNLTTWTDLPDLGVAPYHCFITPVELLGTPRLYVRWKIVLP